MNIRNQTSLREAKRRSNLKNRLPQPLRGFAMTMAVILIAFVCSSIVSWPYVKNLGSYFPDIGDYSLGAGVLWYNADSIKTGRIFDQKEYFKGFQFYPQPYSLAFANNMVSPSIFFAPIYWLTSDIVLSTNFYAFLTLVLSFLTAYYTVNYFVKNYGASLVGAAIFAFAPVNMSRFPQHMDIINKYFLPLVFLFFYRFLEKPTYLRALLFFLFFSLNALSVNYFQIFSILVLPLVAIPFLWVAIRKKNWGYLGRLGRSGLIGLVFLPILLYFNLPYLEFSQKEGASRPLEMTSYYSARIIDYFAPAPESLLYSGWVKFIEPQRTPRDSNLGIFNNYEEHSLGIIVVPLVLLILSFRIKKTGKPFLYFLLISSFVLSLGPYFTGISSEENYFPLPYLLLYKIFPFLEGIRVPARFDFLFIVGLAIFAGSGAKWLMDRYHKAGMTLAIILLALVILESMVVKNYDESSKTLAQVEQIGLDNLSFLKGNVVVHFPIHRPDGLEFGKNSAYINWMLKTGEKIMNGNPSYLPVDQLAFLEKVGNEMGEEAFKKLKVLGVNYVVIHKNMIPNFQSKPLYAQGTILDQVGILVIDLSKYNFNTPICVLERDFDIQLANARDQEFRETRALVLKNKGNCFLPSIYEDRYRKVNNVEFKMPILVEPGEQLILPVDE